MCFLHKFFDCNGMRFFRCSQHQLEFNDVEKNMKTSFLLLKSNYIE